MDFTEKLAVWEKLKAGLGVRREALVLKTIQLDDERKQLEADEAMLQPLEAVMADEITVVAEQRKRDETVDPTKELING